MKKLYLLMSTITILFMVSCTGLDLDPTDRVSENAVWESEETVDAYTTGLYAHMRDASELYSNNLTDCYSDILKSASWDQYNHAYNKALLQVDYFTSTDVSSLDTWCNYQRIQRQS